MIKIIINDALPRGVVVPLDVNGAPFEGKGEALWVRYFAMHSDTEVALKAAVSAAQGWRDCE